MTARPLTEQDLTAIFYDYARTYQQLLGPDWSIDGWVVSNGDVALDARMNQITWLDLAPEGDPRERRALNLPGTSSIGAIVNVAKALAELSREAS
jgi:hypothetical protein